MCVVLLCLAPLNACAGGSVSGRLSGFENVQGIKVVLELYNGFGYIPADTFRINAEGKFKNQNKLQEGFYKLKADALELSQLLYINGSDETRLVISNSIYQTDKVQFKDAENGALKELLAASKRLELTLNTLQEQFDPRKMDSFYLKRIGPYNATVQTAYRNFNKEIQQLKAGHPTTVVADLFSSFYQLPLFDEDEKYGRYYDNQDAYMRDHFFDLWRLNDQRVTLLPELKSKLEKYFRFFARRDYEFLVRSSNNLLNRAKNERVRRYLASLLIDFFSGVKEEDVVVYIVENSLDGCLDGISQNLTNFNHSNLRGSKISDLILPSFDNHPVNLADIYRSAAVTVLYFWSPDCFHCIEFKPVVKKLKDKYSDAIGIYSVCLEDDEKRWHDISKDLPQNFNNTVASGERRTSVVKEYNVKYTPMIYILNGSGKILDRGIAGQDLLKSVSVYF